MSYLYFAPNVEKTAFKIGFSNNPRSRLVTVVGEINYDKTYMFECENATAVENFCHLHFKEYNTRIYKGDGHTEWFDIAIFKVAKDLIIRQTELLGIIGHFPFLYKFKPKNVVAKNTRTPINIPPYITVEKALNDIHRENYANLYYLNEIMCDDVCNYVEGSGKRFIVNFTDKKSAADFLKHNEYVRDSGLVSTFFKVTTLKNKRVLSAEILLDVKTLRETSKSDIRLDCMVSMLEDLHTQLYDSYEI